MPNAWTISIGTELILGQITDTNAPWLARQLAALGIRVQRHIIVSDDLAPICAALREAAARANFVVITGGLGPTDDDLTRSCLAEVAGAPLELHAPSLAHLQTFFAARGRSMPARNCVQAYVPRGAAVLPNSCGTAPGIRLALGPCTLFALPGVPFEMHRMFADSVAPELRARTGGAVVASRVLHTFGRGESDIGERLGDLMERGRNPEVGTTASYGIVSVRINAAADDVTTAEQSLADMDAEVCRRLGPTVFGREDETLASVVGRLLTEVRQTVATAESCTGGLIGKLLTDIPGSSRYFAGGVISYSNDAKQSVLGVRADTLSDNGAVSSPVAGQMAAGVAKCFGTDYGIAVTGIAGPGGGTTTKPVGLVYVGLHGHVGSFVKECRFGADAPRTMIRLRAAFTALDLLRGSLLGLQA